MHGVCVRRGVSNKKLKELRKELTYSLALNVHLPLAFTAATRPSSDLVDAMNRARSKRNDLMHEAAFNLSREELGQLLTDTQNFIVALKAAETFSLCTATAAVVQDESSLPGGTP